MNNQQTEFLNELKMRDCHVFLSEEYVDFVKSQDVDGNISKGMKNIIEDYMKQNRLRIVERYLLWVVFAVCIIILFSLILEAI